MIAMGDFDGRSVSSAGPIGFAAAFAKCRKCFHGNERHVELQKVGTRPTEHCLSCIDEGGPCA
jgi:hypothetical protein